MYDPIPAALSASSGVYGTSFNIFTLTKEKNPKSELTLGMRGGGVRVGAGVGKEEREVLHPKVYLWGSLSQAWYFHKLR